MPGKAAPVTASLDPSGTVAPAAPQKSFPFVLKKIMDIPPPNILEEGDDGKTERAAGTRAQPIEPVYLCELTCAVRF